MIKHEKMTKNGAVQQVREGAAGLRCIPQILGSVIVTQRNLWIF